jgi:hypothetical protein
MAAKERIRRRQGFGGQEDPGAAEPQPKPRPLDRLDGRFNALSTKERKVRLGAISCD